MTEFRILSNLDALRSQVISANFDEVKDWLTENLAPYRGMAVTQDTIPTAKTYRASIRKIRDRIDASRKEVKAAALASYTVFEEKAKTLTSLCDEAANALDSQIRAYEDEEKRQKVEALRAKYDEFADDEIKAYRPWERIYDPKWENKTFSFDAAVDVISKAVQSCRDELEHIRIIGSADTAYLLDYYKTHDITETIRKSAQIKEQRLAEEARARAAAERKAALEAEKARQMKEAEARRKAAAEIVPPPQEAEESEPEIEPEPEGIDPMDEIVTIDFRVQCTKRQLMALGDYMKRNGIKYGRAN